MRRKDVPHMGKGVADLGERLDCSGGDHRTPWWNKTRISPIRGGGKEPKAWGMRSLFLALNDRPHSHA